MKFNLFTAAVGLLLLPVFYSFTNFTNPSEDPANQKKLVLEITSTTGQPVEFSAFIRSGSDNYFVEKETTPYRLEVEDKNFSGVFHKLTEGGQWEVKAQKLLGEKKLTDVKGGFNVTVVESSENTISSWGM